MALTARVREWEAEGGYEDVAGRRLFVWRRDGDGPLLLLLHGFPSSSYDWKRLLDARPQQAALAFDCLGFGLSEKPADVEYTLGWQADAAEALVDGREVFVVGHDMGTSVATELMARDIRGDLRMDIRGVLLFNGSILLHKASPTIGQKILRSRIGPFFARLNSERTFTAQFGRIFSDAHPLEPDEAARPVGAARPQRRPPPPAGDDQLHERARALHGALARRGPRLARRAQLRLGPRGPRRDDRTSSPASASCARTRPSTRSPASATTPRSRHPRDRAGARLSTSLSRCGRLAQLVRAPALQAGGPRFEPGTAHSVGLDAEELAPPRSMLATPGAWSLPVNEFLTYLPVISAAAVADPPHESTIAMPASTCADVIRLPEISIAAHSGSATAILLAQALAGGDEPAAHRERQ